MKQILIIRASKDIPVEAVTDIYCHASHYNIGVESFDVNSEEELEKALNQNIKYDYIYVAAHGNDLCLGENNGYFLSWNDLGAKLCKADCLNDDAILMLYCCRGGLNQVAYKLFASCPNIQYVCGARQNMKSIDLIIGFNVFLYNIECRNIDPILAADKATLATENRFKYFDRLEVESEPMYYYNYCPDCVNSETIYYEDENSDNEIEQNGKDT